MPHLVLPLSGCLSRHTPTRATRGEARGHRSVLAQNSLLMYPTLFLPLDWSSVWCVLAIWWTGPHCVCAAVVASLSGVVRWRHIVDMWVAEGHTARWPRLCVLYVHRPRCGCRPASGMSTPSRCRVLVHCRGQWCRDSLGNNGSARLCVCGNRGRRAHIGYPKMVGEGWEDEGTIRWHSCGYLCRCGDRPLRPVGWRSMAAHPSDS